MEGNLSGTISVPPRGRKKRAFDPRIIVRAAVIRCGCLDPLAPGRCAHFHVEPAPSLVSRREIGGRFLLN
jgi:hypothetical protein